jgi:hypothetical protein
VHKDLLVQLVHAVKREQLVPLVHAVKREQLDLRK